MWHASRPSPPVSVLLSPAPSTISSRALRPTPPSICTLRWVDVSGSQDTMTRRTCAARGLPCSTDVPCPPPPSRKGALAAVHGCPDPRCTGDRTACQKAHAHRPWKNTRTESVAGPAIRRGVCPPSPEWAARPRTRLIAAVPVAPRARSGVAMHRHATTHAVSRRHLGHPPGTATHTERGARTVGQDRLQTRRAPCSWAHCRPAPRYCHPRTNPQQPPQAGCRDTEQPGQGLRSHGGRSQALVWTHKGAPGPETSRALGGGSLW
jgi:hypothetical protein